MYIKKIIFFYFIFFIFSCGGNYSGNEGEIKKSLTFQTKSFMAVGDTGSIITSDDGIEWESVTSGTAQNLNGIAFGGAIGIVGDAGVRANAQQDKLFVGMILILIFAEALGLYGLIVALILSQSSQECT